jgi:hypothetical protein
MHVLETPHKRGSRNADEQAAANREEGLYQMRRPEIYAPRIRPGRIAEIRISVEDVE